MSTLTFPTPSLRRWAPIFAVVAMFAFGSTGCSKKVAETEAPAADDAMLGDSDSGKAGGLQTVNFAYDSFVLDESSKSILKANADILKDKASVKVQVEGHCDQRGGTQYNIALGEKRANVVRNYLVDLGIAEDRLSTISYGKDRLLEDAETEAAYARNRRANFVITSR